MNSAFEYSHLKTEYSLLNTSLVESFDEEELFEYTSVKRENDQYLIICARGKYCSKYFEHRETSPIDKQ